MSRSLDFSIDHIISPEDLLTLVLQEPQLKLAHIGPRKRREDEEGLPPIVETHVILPSYDVVIVAYAQDEIWREIKFELMQVAPRVCAFG